jgi:hypothetical protein
MNEEALQSQIAELRTKLVGDIFQDGEVQMQIYELKKQLNPVIELEPEMDHDDECLSCGA